MSWLTDATGRPAMNTPATPHREYTEAARVYSQGCARRLE